MAEWQTPTILKIENRDISTTVWPILTKFYKVTHFWPLDLRLSGCSKNSKQSCIWKLLPVMFNMVDNQYLVFKKTVVSMQWNFAQSCTLSKSKYKNCPHDSLQNNLKLHRWKWTLYFSNRTANINGKSLPYYNQVQQQQSHSSKSAKIVIIAKL